MSRDNLSSLPFALVTYRQVKNWFTHLLDRSQTAPCLNSTLFHTYGPKISIFDMLANDHFIVWPSSNTLTFNLPEKMFQMNNCAKLFEIHEKYTSYGLYKSRYDHFIIWPSSVTLTFNLTEQMFQMNNCAKLFWNPCINVQIIVLTSWIYDRFLIWLSSVTLNFNLNTQMFQMNNSRDFSGLCPVLNRASNKPKAQR